MNADEKEIYEMLTAAADTYLSVQDISKRLGRGRKFEEDRNWARPILRRMELDGWIESNPFGDYRRRDKSGDTTNFYKAIDQPGVSLGETTIISLGDTEPNDGEKLCG